MRRLAKSGRKADSGVLNRLLWSSAVDLLTSANSACRTAIMARKSSPSVAGGVTGAGAGRGVARG
jgi:hypothetical protein